MQEDVETDIEKVSIEDIDDEEWEEQRSRPVFCHPDLILSCDEDIFTVRQQLCINFLPSPTPRSRR